MAEESGREEAGAKRSIPQTSQEQEDEITLFFFFLPSVLPLFHPSVWKGKDATPPLLPGGCLVWGLVNVCCDSWGSHERPSGQLGLPTHTYSCSASSTPSHPYATVAWGLDSLSSVRSHLALQWPLTSSTARHLAAWVAEPLRAFSGLLLQAGTRQHHSGNVACNNHLINAARGSVVL